MLNFVIDLLIITKTRERENVPMRPELTPMSMLLAVLYSPWVVRIVARWRQVQSAEDGAEFAVVDLRYDVGP